MSEPASLFSVRDLRVSFDGRQALRIDSLDLEEGRVSVLAGENGSGKTTLLRVLNGLLAPSAGRVSYRGAPLTGDGRRAVRADSVLVHQVPLLFRGTVGQNVAYGPKVRGADRAEAGRRVAESLALVGMGGFERRRASALSGGEKQRVAIARALAIRAKVLLLDEPTANIDPEFRRSIEALVRAAAAAGTTVVASSHDREFAYRVCDRLVPLEDGRIAPLRENIFRGEVARTDEQFAYFRTGSADLRCPAREGDFAVAVLPLDDVIVSREPLSSSARNRFRGTVVAISQEAGLLRITVDCGFPVQALITRAAAEELDMAGGREYCVTFKASAVRLY